MKIHYNSRNVLFRELEGDQYGIKAIPQNSIKYMLDIGAAYGVMSLLARLVHPALQITAIEPHPETYKDLCDNVDRMKINTINAALGNGDKFYLFKERKMRLCNSFTQEKNDNTEIQSYTLAGLIDYSQVDSKDLAVKIDCEGAEHHMIGNSFDEYLLQQAKLIGIEVHNDTKKFYDWIIALLGRTHEISIHNYSDTLGVVKAVRCG